MRIGSVVGKSCVWVGCGLMSMCVASVGAAQAGAQTATNQAWMNSALDPDTRADLVVKQMTLDEKIQLVHGIG